MTPEKPERPASEAVAEASSATAVMAPAAKPTDEFDPIGWEVPLLCKDCGKGFKVPYRHFQAGVVFHCPHCHGSFVPKVDIYRTVRETFETFYARRKRDREDFARIGGDETAFRHEQERDLAQFHQMLDRLAHAMRPAGKMVKPKWLRAMFT